MFNEAFLRGAPDVLAELAPELAGLAPALRVIDVERASPGLRLRVGMDGDAEQAVGYLAS